VKQYEPYFSTSRKYENDSRLVEIGVTPFMHYDPVGRVVRTDFPNGTFSKVEFNGWMQKDFDPNGTILDSDWYANFMAGTVEQVDAANKAAAQQTANARDGMPLDTKTPKGYIWHHHQDSGRMQLVEQKVHQKTGHDGAWALWGKAKKP